MFCGIWSKSTLFAQDYLFQYLRLLQYSTYFLQSKLTWKITHPINKLIRHIYLALIILVLKFENVHVATFRPKKKNFIFPISRPTVKKMHRLFFFAYKEKKINPQLTRTIPVFIYYVHYIICPYQFQILSVFIVLLLFPIWLHPYKRNQAH